MRPHLLDVNVWLALTLSAHVHHGVARDWLSDIDQPEVLVMSRDTQLALLRLLTNQAVLGAYGNPPLTNDEAWGVVDAFLADDRITLLDDEPSAVETYLRKFSARGSASPKLWMDAYLAAVAVAGGLVLTTLDGAFRQFEGLDLLLLHDATD